MRVSNRVWFVGLTCLCLTLSFWAVKNKAISEESKIRIEYLYRCTEEFGGYEPELVSKTVYDSEGNTLEEALYGEDDHGQKTVNITTYAYDNMGNIIAEEWKLDDLVLIKTTYTYEYDEGGKKIKKIEYDEGGNKSGITHYRHDDNGNLIEQIRNAVHSEEQLSLMDKVGLSPDDYNQKWVYRYDKNGNQIERIHYHPIGILKSRGTCEYDEKGRKIEERYSFRNGETITTTRRYVYGDENKIGHILYGSGGELKGLYVYKYRYEEEGNKVEEIKYECKSMFAKTKEIPRTKPLYDYSSEQESRKGYTFRKTTWGMSKEAVETTEIGKILYDTEEMLVYEGSIAGLDCEIIYISTEGKLVRAKYLITEEHSNKNMYISDYDNLKEKLIRKYGQPISDTHYWSRDLYKDDPQYWGFAVSIGDLRYFAMWETPQTSITLALHGDNYDITLAIEYRSQELTELEEREKEKRLLEDF